MILHRISPARDMELKHALQAQTKNNLSSLQTLKDVHIYVNELLLSGKYEEAKTTVCIIGNTGSGKSSLVRTLKRYSHNQTQKLFSQEIQKTKSLLRQNFFKWWKM